MPETPLLAVRCPIDVLDQIESEKNLTGRSKTDVVIDRLRNSIPSLAVTDRHKLPAIAAIYQVFTSNNNLLYIGITDNLKQDWESHPLYGQFLESDVNSRITWFTDRLPAIDPNLVKKSNSVSDTVNTDRDSHSENLVSSDQLEYAIANSEIIKGIQSKLDDMERLLRLQREASLTTYPPDSPNQGTIKASIASPIPTGETSPLPPSPSLPPDKLGEGGNGDIFPDSPPSPPDQPAIEEIKKKITLPDTSIVYPIGIVETVEPDPSIDTELEAIEPLTSEPIPIDDTVASAIETVTVEVVNEANSSIESVTDAIKTVLGEPDSTIDTEPGAIETDSKPWYTVKELLDCHYPGWPTTSDKLRKKAETEQWPKRTRRGSKGNPYEYQAVLPSQGKG